MRQFSLKQKRHKQNLVTNQLINEIRRQYNNNQYSIETSANKILDTYNIQKDKAIPIVNILENIGINVYQDSMQMTPNTIAYLVVNPKLYHEFVNNKIICVNSHITYESKRFILAHELAHYIFDYSENTQSTFYNMYKSTDTNNTEVEIRANLFAEHLLLPKTEFLTLYNVYLTETKSLSDTIVKLAQNYSVNISCINERINHLLHDNCLN